MSPQINYLVLNKMGVYNSIFFECPNCGETLDFQSKARDSEYESCDQNSIPVAIAHDINGSSRL